MLAVTVACTGLTWWWAHRPGPPVEPPPPNVAAVVMPGGPARHEPLEVEIPEGLRAWRGEAIDPCARDERASRPWPRASELVAERRARLETWRAAHAGDELIGTLDALALPERRNESVLRLAADPRRHDAGVDLLRDTMLVLAAEAFEARRTADANDLAHRITEAGREDALSWLVAGMLWSFATTSPSAPAGRAALAEAFRLAPDDPNTSLLYGLSLYTTSDVDEALRVLDVHEALAGPDPRTARARYRLAMRRDMLGHRRLTRRGAVSLLTPADLDAARADWLLEIVDRGLADASALLGAPTPDELTVIVYATVDDLVSASCSSTWAGAQYSGILEMSADRDDAALTATARHETMHAVMIWAAARNAPGWFAEGVAEYVENDAAARVAAAAHVADLGRTIPLRSMAGHLSELSDDTNAALAYHQALAMVLWLVELHGEGVIAEGMRWLGSESTESLFATLHGRPFDEAAFLAFARRYAERERAAVSR